MTLADAIAEYEATRAQPINARTSALTPLGHAVWAANRLPDAPEPLPAEERGSVLRHLPGPAGAAPTVA